MLTDFGLSEELVVGRSVVSKAGTRGYWAPECLRRLPQGKTADWWSLGVVLAYAATGEHPFGSSSDAPQPADAQLESGRTSGAHLQRALAVEDPACEPIVDGAEPHALNGVDQDQWKPAEALLNQNTLTLPLEPLLTRTELGEELLQMLSGMLNREPADRLGAVSTEQVCSRPHLN